MTLVTVHAQHEVWPLAEPFTISRGSKLNADVLTVTIADGTYVGRGEAVPYARYDETIDLALRDAATFKSGTPTALAAYVHTLRAGAARNALDCALWDYHAKRSGISAARSAGIAAIRPVTTAYTLSLAAPDTMARKAREAARLPLLKLKLGGDSDDEARMRAVRTARPDARLIADANEAWTSKTLEALLAVAAELGFETVEQPLPVRADAALASISRPLPVCADESCHTARDITRLSGLYDAVNIKLDKSGGLTSALELQKAARAAGFRIMVGSMVATSLAVAPALLLAQDADWVDLDGPLLLAQDRPGGLTITDGVISAADAALWG